jgi:hypothetical protein
VTIYIWTESLNILIYYVCITDRGNLGLGSLWQMYYGTVLKIRSSSLFCDNEHRANLNMSMYPKSREGNIRSTCQNISKFDTNRCVITNAHKSMTLMQTLSQRNQSHNAPPDFFSIHFIIFLLFRNFPPSYVLSPDLVTIDGVLYWLSDLTLTEGNLK